jgi:hypothetical protein
LDLGIGVKSQLMVQLVRNSKIVGIMVAAFLWLFGPIFSHWTHDDETPDDEVAASIQEKQRNQIAPPPPPPVIQPRHHDAWPWFEDKDNSWYHAAQEGVRRQNNFLIVTSGARRQAMNEFEVVTA